MPSPLLHKGAISQYHSEMVGEHLHPPFYAQENDPGAVGANIAWFNTFTNILSVRNSTNSGWIEVQPGSHNHDSSYVNVTGDTMTGGLTIDVDGTGLSVRDAAGVSSFAVQTTALLVQVRNAADLVVYTGAGSGEVARIDGATGNISTSGSLTLGTDLAVTEGGTGASSASVARTNLEAEAYTSWIGPWRGVNIPGTATTNLELMFYGASNAAVQGSNQTFRAGRTGEIVGCAIVANASRSGGTMIVRPTIGGVQQTFNSDACLLDATTVRQMTSIVAPGLGVNISSGGNQLAVDVVTSGFTPTTLEVLVWMLIRYSSF